MASSEILVTVIIPTYKPQDYLWECLESLNNQTLDKSQYEVYLILNGCNEPYNSKIIEWLSCHQDLRVFYRQIDMGGVSNARNEALAMASGEYVTFIDDDDYVSPTYLSDLLDAASKETIAVSNSIAFDSQGVFYDDYAPHQNYIKNSCNKDTTLIKASKNLNGPWMKLIHREIIKDSRFEPRFKNGEDALFIFLISYRAKHLKYTAERAKYYRRYREDGACYSKFSMSYSIRNNCLLILYYIKYWIRHPFAYNFLFFLNRLAATFKSMIYNIFNITY